VLSLAEGVGIINLTYRQLQWIAQHRCVGCLNKSAWGLCDGCYEASKGFNNDDDKLCEWINNRLDKHPNLCYRALCDWWKPSKTFCENT